jgi:hypothetical protein
LGLHSNSFIVYMNSEGAIHFYFLKLYPLTFFLLVVYFLVFFILYFSISLIIFCNLFQFTFYDIIVVLNKCHVIWFMLDFLRAYFNWIIFIFFFSISSFSISLILNPSSKFISVTLSQSQTNVLVFGWRSILKVFILVIVTLIKK